MDDKIDRDDLLSEFDKIKDNHNLNIEQYIVNGEEDLPDFGKSDMSEYDERIVVYEQKSLEIIENLADVYLGDNEDLINHAYIQNKIKEDAKYYASLQLLKDISEKLLMKQITQVDNGETNAVMYKAINETMREVRDNIKDGRVARTEIEKMYREMRKDFGLNDSSAKAAESSVNADADDGATIVDTKKLNDIISQHLNK